MTRNSDSWSSSFRTALLWSCLALLPASSSQAAFYRVDDTGDDGINNGTCNLREAITAASTNLAVDGCPAGSSTFADIIHVPAGTYAIDLTSAGSDLDITDPVTIHGASPEFTIIEASGGSAVDRLLDIGVGAGSVVLEDLALRGGNAVGSFGGNIRVAAAVDVTLVNVEVSGGVATIGGGIYSAGDLTLSGGRVSGNQTPAGSGGDGGGIASSGGSLTLEHVEVSGNQADDDGGGIHINNVDGVTLIHSKLTDNTAGGSGGGLDQTGDDFIIEWSELARNQAAIGGGMRANGTGETTRSAFIDNVATTRGGGIADEVSGIVRFSTIAGNSSPLGAGVHANSMMTLLDSNTIARNIGDGVYNVTGVFFENNLLAENSGASCAGAAPAFGAFNLEDTNTCGFVSGVDMPNFPNTAPLIGPLQDNGGPTPSIGLLAGSPAIDVVSSEIRINCEKMLDQRGNSRGRPRSQNEAEEDVFHCDIGAFEATAAFVVDSLLDGVDADPNDDVCETAAGTCTLRAAIQQANGFPGRSEIDLGPGTHTLSIAGADEDAAVTGDLDIFHRVILRGAGTDATTIDGGGLDRVLQFGCSTCIVAFIPGPSRIEDLTIRGGNLPTADGGGFFAFDDVRLERVRLSQNQGYRGSAASGSYAPGGARLEMLDSTVDNNTGRQALYFREAKIERSSLIDNTSTNTNGGAGEFSTVHLLNSTVSGNTADATGAFFAQQAFIDSSAIYDNASTFAPGGPFILSLSVMRNSIIANNRAGGVTSNCSMNSNASVSLGFNITDGPGSDCQLDDSTDQLNTDPLLGPLADNGGPTDTHLPLAGSPAIDLGDPLYCPALDQRGLPRPQDGDENGSPLCDIGPIELPEPSAALGLGAGGLLLTRLARRRSAPRSREG